MYLLNYVHKLTTGDGENGVSVEVRRIWDDTLVSTVVSEGSEVDGRVTYSQNGSAGRVYLKMSSGGQTRRVYGDVSLQRYGGWSDADLFELWKLFGDGVVDGVGAGMAVGAPMVAGRSVSVETGMILGKGQAHVQRAKTDLAVAANASGSTRIDSVVVRFTLTGSSKWSSTVAVKTGDVTIVNTAATFEFQLATIAVANAVAALTTGDVTDTRYTAGIQGYVWRMPVARTAGDLFYVGSDGKVARLAAGTPGQVMRISGGVPSWDTVTADDIDGTVSQAEFGYLSNVTSDLQTQLDGKQPLDPDLTLLAAKTIPAGALVGTTDAQTLSNKTLSSPTIATPVGLVKGDVGLGNVDDTADASKPISTATQTALDGKQPLDGDLSAFALKTAPAGAVVGTTDAQTLTNKTLTSPTISGVGSVSANTLAATSAALGLTVQHSAAIGTDLADTLTVNAMTTLAAAIVSGSLSVGGFFDLSGFIARSVNMQTTPDVATEAAGSYVTAMDSDLVLGTGTWTIYVLGFVYLRSTASVTNLSKLVIDGTSGDELTRTYAATNPSSPAIMLGAKSGVTSGTKTIAVQYKRGASGTAEAFSTGIFAVALRTA